jgi:drug/metabolite transporter (DMT)-like permease
MTAIQRWTKGLASTLGTVAVTAVFLMLVSYFEGDSFWPPSTPFLAALCILGFFHFTGYPAGAKAERKAAAATFDGGTIHAE